MLHYCSELNVPLEITSYNHANLFHVKDAFGAGAGTRHINNDADAYIGEYCQRRDAGKSRPGIGRRRQGKLLTLLTVFGDLQAASPVAGSIAH